MNYTNPTLRRALAGEYALGSLTPGARRRFEKLMLDDRALRQEVAQWEEALVTLTHPLAPQQPPQRVWTAIQARIRSNGGAAAKRTRSFWQWLAGAAVAMSVVIALVVNLQNAPAALYQARLNNDANVAALAVDATADTLEIRQLALADVAPDRSLELWIVPAKGNAISLGVIPPSGKVTVKLSAAQKREIGARTLLAVTLEPHGGSPTGVATGPILYKGYLQAPA
jgi:anti-sigma-K factor RskA